MEKKTLIDHGQKLFRVLTFPCMTTKRMAKLKECVLHLANSITKYSEYLDTQNKRMMEIHNLPHPVRTPGDGISTSPRSIKSQNLLEKYSDIQYSSSIQCVKKSAQSSTCSNR